MFSPMGLETAVNKWGIILWIIILVWELRRNLMDLKKMPLQVLLKEMLILDTAKQSSDMAEYASLTPEALKNATILISIFPMLILYPYLQKYFVGGIMIGAVKG